MFTFNAIAKPLRNPLSRRSLAPLLVACSMLSACAATPPAPAAALQAAEQSIRNAERERVAEYAAPELSEARAKLAAAHAAVGRDDMTQARRLAEQARADAELASAKAEVGKASAVNAEMQKSIDILQQEISRNTGVR
ncbi:MAG: DUF4398 domain-containing protein [Xanthomonadaceae bacterium]|nr:DUF4398 domain-containing protein [Xanthomonadaceae bacterium]